MKTAARLTAASAMALALLACASRPSMGQTPSRTASRTDGWLPLFDGKSLTGWRASENPATFRVPGGQIGRYKNVMVGAPEFRQGEEVVLFLSAAGPSIAHVFGLNQGVYRVRVDPRTGRRLVVPPVLTAASDAPQAVVRGDQTRQPLALDTFAASVRTAMLRTDGVR